MTALETATTLRPPDQASWELVLLAFALLANGAPWAEPYLRDIIGQSNDVARSLRLYELLKRPRHDCAACELIISRWTWREIPRSHPLPLHTCVDALEAAAVAETVPAQGAP